MLNLTLMESMLLSLKGYAAVFKVIILNRNKTDVWVEIILCVLESVKCIGSDRNTYEVFGMYLHEPAYSIIFIVNVNPIQVKCYLFG